MSSPFAYAKQSAMTQLSVNVNKLATLRNSRGKNTPDVTLMADKICAMGVHGITVHPRPDGRHIRTQDVLEISQLLAEKNRSGQHLEFNIEGFPSPEFIKMIEQVRPQQVTLVPDPPDALTSNAGWDLVTNEKFLNDVLAKLKSSGARVSLFVEPGKFNLDQREALLRVKPERIELYTEDFADHFLSPDRDQVTRSYAEVAKFASDNGIGVNAGHDLNQTNLGYLIDQIPLLAEVSIGHALFCEAIEQGLATTVRNYLEILKTHGS
jgi:pyridoxine 5-phosphate synthase